MDLGYYFAASVYGSFLQQVRPYTDFTFCEAGWTTNWGYHGSEEAFVTHMRRAHRQGFKIHLNFQWDKNQDSRFKDTVRLAAPYWDAVELIDVRDEPGGALAPAVNDIKDAIRSFGLRLRPIGAVFTQEEILTGRAKLVPLSWVGIEAYVHPNFQDDGSIMEMRKVLRAQLDVLPNKPIVVVGQAYDRNGKWKNTPSLRALQIPTYQEAKRDPRVTHLRWFSYGRRGGTLAHPSLIPKHIMIAELERM